MASESIVPDYISIDEGFFASLHFCKPEKIAKRKWICRGCGRIAETQKELLSLNEFKAILNSQRRKGLKVFIYSPPKPKPKPRKLSKEEAFRQQFKQNLVFLDTPIHLELGTGWRAVYREYLKRKRQAG